jgi:CubicO group peptidase (beta-lactamase class C family)
VTAISIAVARRGSMVYARGYGLADPLNNIAATETTVYAIGSITKQFTATMIVQLAEQHRLDLDEHVAAYLPQAPHAAEITVRQLLDQRSGLADYLADPFTVVQFANSTTVTPAELLVDVAKQPLHFAPGTSWEYSNSNYIILGMLVEKLAGKPYAAALTDRITGPLHLNATTFDVPAPGPQTAVAMSWDSSANHAVPQPRWSSQVAFAAGALNSNVVDLVAWDAAFFAGKVVTPASVATMTTPPPFPSGRAGDYAFGWIASDLYGHRRIWHNGGIPGFSAQNNVFPDDGLEIVVLANDIAFDASPLVKEILSVTGVVTASERDADRRPKAAAGEDAAVTALARAQYDAFRRGTIDSTRYTDAMKAAITPEIVAQVRSALVAAGTIVSVTFTGVAEQAGVTMSTYTVVCEHGTIIELIGIGRDGQIAALFFRPA